MPTASFTNADDLSHFVATNHAKPYPAIDPKNIRLPENFVACIIGGSGAAGSGLARSYAQAGAAGIILAGRTASSLEATAKEARALNGSTNVVTVPCDITSNDDISALAVTIKDTFRGRLDVVVVNSGYSGPLSKATILEEDPKDVEKAFGIHCLGTWYAAHYLVPLLLESQGSFFAISSMAAPRITGFGTTSHYCASKVGQIRIMEMLHAQYAPQGLFCASVHPGGMQSDFSRAASKDIQHRKRSISKRAFSLAHTE
jgi:NAD(P)-dependent dehydrogenase (short-subunit alcohol dehydrogenase family)